MGIVGTERITGGSMDSLIVPMVTIPFVGSLGPSPGMVMQPPVAHRRLPLPQEHLDRQLAVGGSPGGPQPPA